MYNNSVLEAFVIWICDLTRYIIPLLDYIFNDKKDSKVKWTFATISICIHMIEHLKGHTMYFKTYYARDHKFWEKYSDHKLP